MEFYWPWAFVLLAAVPFVIWRLRSGRGRAAVQFSSVRIIEGHGVSWRQRLRPALAAARAACLVCLIIALARPRQGTAVSQISTDGVAIQMVVDRSGSMSEEMVFGRERLSRLEVVKRVFEDFVKGDGKYLDGRHSDLVGLVTFARYASTICPLVQDHGALVDMLRDVTIVGVSSEDGTAIGDAVALAAARLKRAEDELNQRRTAAGQKADEGLKIKSKAIVLLTDGINNAGRHAPMEAAELARQWDITIYAIGVGGEVFRTFGGRRISLGLELDEPGLRAMSELTGGFYARAEDGDAMREICRRIDELEKTQIRSIEYAQWAERFMPWACVALAALTLEILAGSTILRKIP